MVEPGADPAEPIDGLILAGGQSLRMRTPATPDADKGLQMWQGRPLVAWACDTLRTQGVGTIWISANRNLQDYGRYGRVLQDPATPSGGGPLLGVLAGLQHARASWLFILPVDVLRCPPDLLLRLRAVAHPDRPAYARTPDGPHPLCLVVHRGQAAGLRAFLDSGERRVQGWLQCCQAQAVEFPQRDCLINLNTPQDWARWHGAPG